MKNNLLTTNEAADILGVTRWRINKMIQSGRLKAEKFDRFYLIEESELKNVENRKVGRPPKIKNQI
jgi:excisionase family DNA binding protein